jgi:hypothetical protein
MNDFFRTDAKDVGGPLTREVLEKAIEDVRRKFEREWHEPHRHLVNPRSKQRVIREGGCLQCADCGEVICVDAP